MKDDDNRHWHLDRKVPIVLIFAILCNSGLGIWWLSNLSARVSQVEKEQTKAESFNSDIITMKENLRGIETSVKRIESYFTLKAKETLLQ